MSLGVCNPLTLTFSLSPSTFSHIICVFSCLHVSLLCVLVLVLWGPTTVSVAACHQHVPPTPMHFLSVAARGAHCGVRDGSAVRRPRLQLVRGDHLHQQGELPVRVLCHRQSLSWPPPHPSPISSPYSSHSVPASIHSPAFKCPRKSATQNFLLDY